MKKEKWDNLIEYFPEPFDKISDIEVYLFLDIPRIFSFKDLDGNMYLSYIAELNYENFDTKWIVSKIDMEILKNILTEKIPLNNGLINKFKDVTFIEIADQETIKKVEVSQIETYLPSEEFYLNLNIPNEINLAEIITELFSPVNSSLDNSNSWAVSEEFEIIEDAEEDIIETVEYEIFEDEEFEEIIGISTDEDEEYNQVLKTYQETYSSLLDRKFNDLDQIKLELNKDVRALSLAS